MSDLETEMPEKTLKKYEILSEEDLRNLNVPGSATPTRVYLSSITLVACLELDLPPPISGPVAPAIVDGLEPHRRQVRRIMRLLAHRLGEHGVDCPAVVLLSPRRVSGLLTESALEYFRRVYHVLAADQDWHRGEFLVFVEAGVDKVRERLLDLLAPEPPKVQLSSAAQTLSEVIARCESAAEQNLLLSGLLEAWKRALEEAERESPEKTKRDEYCSRAGEREIETFVKRALEPADNLLAEMG
jgi:hypothetical protein